MAAASVRALCVAALLATGGGVSVERIRLPLEQELTLFVNSSVEYIVELHPPAGQVEEPTYPVRLLTELLGRVLAQPVLLTARRGSSADTWQLPAPADTDGVPPLPALERTLCPADDDGAGIPCEGGEAVWSVHVSAACGAAQAVRLRGGRGGWALRGGESQPLVASQDRPRLARYRWEGDERAVSLQLDADDDICATVAVMNYTCPLPQSVPALPTRAMRLTMLRSATAYVKRSEYPEGFVVALLVRESGEPCGLKPPPESSWLWGAALLATTPPAPPVPPAEKRVSVAVRQPLPRARYWLASVLTLALLGLCYLAAGGLALASRRGYALTLTALSCRCCTPQPAEGAGAGTPRTPDDGGMLSAPPAPSRSPAAPCLATLCTRPAAARARSRRQLAAVAVVAVFYWLPVLQLVASFQLLLNVSGQLDLCYYNARCAHPAPPLQDLNHVFSNAGYVLLGALFVLQVQCSPGSSGSDSDNDSERGVPGQRGLLAALGGGLMALGLLSACYHVCPNRLNFQFDTAFMYVLSALLMTWLYSARHPDLGCGPNSVLGSLAILLVVVVAGVLGGGAAFWSVWSAAHVVGALVLSLRLYYGGAVRQAVAQWPRALATRPQRAATAAMLMMANALNWGLAIYGLVVQPRDFAGHLLSVLLANSLLHLLWYLASKLRHGERPSPAAWAFLAAAAVTWPAALVFFLWPASDWSAPPALSRHYNHECLVLGFYDSHDLWHLLSALALYLTFNALLVLDDDQAKVPREHIAVF